MDIRELLARAMMACVCTSMVAGNMAKADETEGGSLTKLTSGYSFSDTVQKLDAALVGKGFTVFATIDQMAAAKSVGLDMPPTVLLIYGNPKGGTPLMVAAPDFAIELPLKVLVRQESDGKVAVVYQPAASLEGKHGLPAGLAAKLGAGEPLIAAAVEAAN